MIAHAPTAHCAIQLIRNERNGAVKSVGGTQDVGDLERGTHPPQPVGALSGVFSGAASMPSLSSGLITARTVRVATLV